MHLARIVIILAIAACSIVCDFRFGGCPKVQYELTTFDLNRYTGTWKEVARSKSVPFEKGDCAQAVYTLNDDGTIRVQNSGVYNGNLKVAIGKAEPTDNQFRFLVSFSESFVSKLFKGDYQVVNTDYDNFAFVYSCTDLIFARIEYAWILSRNAPLDSDKLKTLVDYATHKLNIDPSSFYFTKHSDDVCSIK